MAPAARWIVSPSGIAYGRRIARRGPAMKPASTRSGITAESATGSPSKRSTASRFRPVRRVCSTSARRRPEPARRRARCSGTSVRPPRSTNSAASPPRSTTCAPATRAARPSARFGPRQCSSVRLCRIGCSEDERRAFSSSRGRSSRRRSTAPSERELRATETLDEVPAPTEAERLERAQLPVHRAVPAGDPLGANAVPRDDALTLEQELRERPGARLVPKRTSDQRPCVAVAFVARRRENRRGRRSSLRHAIAAAPRGAAATRRSSPLPPTRDPTEPAGRPRRRDLPAVEEVVPRTRPSDRAPLRIRSWASPSGAGAAADLCRARQHPRGSRPRRGRARRRPRRARRSRRGDRAAPAGSRARAGAAPRPPRATPAGAALGAARAPRAGVARRSIPCHEARKRANADRSTGSTSRRSAASDARRRRRRTSGSHHSRSVPPGRSSPRTSRSSRSSSRSTARRLDRTAQRPRGRERPAAAGPAANELALTHRRIGHLEERVG